MWHTEGVARGWESKSVEEQIEQAASPREPTTHLTDEQRRRRQAQQSLELSRTRVLRELAAATHPRHRALLEATLKFLDDKLAEL